MSKERWIAVGAVVAVVSILSLAGCGGSSKEEGAPSPETTVEPTTEKPAAGSGNANEALAELAPKSGSAVTGQAAFFLDGDNVTLSLSLQNLPPGVHAVHIHEFGDCSAADGSSAGGHWNPMGHNHGKWNQAPFHMGDLGNVTADEYGNGTIAITTSLWTIGTGQEDDVVGKSIIVHASADDFVTQPTGNAGGRLACGVIGS
jgi:Cu-Zn family superoxide dismutase